MLFAQKITCQKQNLLLLLIPIKVAFQFQFPIIQLTLLRLRNWKKLNPQKRKRLHSVNRFLAHLINHLFSILITILILHSFILFAFLQISSLQNEFSASNKSVSHFPSSLLALKFFTFQKWLLFSLFLTCHDVTLLFALFSNLTLFLLAYNHQLDPFRNLLLQIVHKLLFLHPPVLLRTQKIQN